MARRRRGAGEGSIHRRKDGRWVGVADLGWQDGQAGAQVGLCQDPRRGRREAGKGAK
jgi:hypothetical protein